MILGRCTCEYPSYTESLQLCWRLSAYRVINEQNSAHIPYDVPSPYCCWHKRCLPQKFVFQFWQKLLQQNRLRSFHWNNTNNMYHYSCPNNTTHNSAYRILLSQIHNITCISKFQFHIFCSYDRPSLTYPLNRKSLHPAPTFVNLNQVHYLNTQFTEVCPAEKLHRAELF